MAAERPLWVPGSLPFQASQLDYPWRKFPAGFSAGKPLREVVLWHRPCGVVQTGWASPHHVPPGRTKRPELVSALWAGIKGCPMVPPGLVYPATCPLCLRVCSGHLGLSDGCWEAKAVKQVLNTSFHAPLSLLQTVC